MQYDIYANAYKSNQVAIYAVQGESNSRTVIFNIIEKSGVISATSNAKVTNKMLDLTDYTPYLYIIKPDKKLIFATGTVVDASNGVVSFTLPYQATTAAGTADCVIMLVKDDTNLRITGISLNIEAANIDGTIESTDDFSALQNALSSINSVNKRIDNIIANSVETDGNSELIDIRTAEDGTVYQSAGTAVRNQFKETNASINEYLYFMETLGFSNAVISNKDFIEGAYTDEKGYRNDGNYGSMRTHHQSLPIDDYTIHLNNSIDNMLITIGLFADENDTWINAYPSLNQITNDVYTIDSQDILNKFPGTQFIRINILSYSDNTYYDISEVSISVYKIKGKTIIDDVTAISQKTETLKSTFESTAERHENTLQMLVNREITTPVCYNTGHKNINIIGDSISQGASASNIANDSYCGILRKMFAAELGGKLNYGFSAFDKSSDLGFENSTVTWVYGSSMYGWERNYADSNVLGGDSYTSVTEGSKFCFKLWKNFHYMQIAMVGGNDKGSFKILDSNNNLIAEIDCKDYDSGACLSEKINISSIDASNGFEFIISTNTNDPVIISGVSLSDSNDYWTFNNYGRAGARPSVFIGDIFNTEAQCSVLIYALGVNSGLSDLETAINDIKDTAKELPAQKIVLCLCFKGNGFDNRSGGKPEALKAFADYVGALYIDVYEHCPKDENGDPIEGFLSSDHVHPTNEGHQFIAELIAKKISLSCNSKGMAEILSQN